MVVDCIMVERGSYYLAGISCIWNGYVDSYVWMLDGNEDPHFKSEIASDKVLWAHNPQAQILFLYEKGFWAYPKIFFHQ